jgi:HrpA-like RNA helicase
MITPELPIKAAKRALLYALDTHCVLILTAETGSGKTTQIPKYLIEAGYTRDNKKIAITVPRRIAAISIVNRISEELGVYGHEIAHHVRFSSTVNENTRVVFMTDGMMVQELYSDPDLSEYSVVMLDDIHEKSSNCEILLGLLKRIIYRRETTSNKLKLLITSATIDTAKL